MKLMFPVVLDAGQPAADAVAILGGADLAPPPAIVAVRERAGLDVVWWIADAALLIEACTHAKADESVGNAMLVAPFRLGVRAVFHRAAVRDVRDVRSAPTLERAARGWLVVLAGQRMIGVSPPILMSAPPLPPAFGVAPAPLEDLPVPVPAASRGGGAFGRGPTRGQRAKPSPPEAAGAADPAVVGEPAATTSTVAGAAIDTLLAMPRVVLPLRCPPGADRSVTLTIGLEAPATPMQPGIMAFVSERAASSIVVDLMIEAPDFTCSRGWKHTLTVDKREPFAASVALQLAAVSPDDASVRVSTVRVHYSYHGQPAGTAARRIALGDVADADAAALVQPAPGALQLAPSAAPVDLTIRIARRDESDAARDLIWTLMDCPHEITLPDAPITQKVGDRDTASSFASKVTSQVNAADGTVTIDNMLCGIGTLVRRAMPQPVLKALADVATAVGTERLARVLLLTDECFIPWELALLDPPPSAARAPYLGAQFAVSRWIHGEADVPVPPPASLSVANLAIVLGNYDASSLAALPHAKEESDALQSAAIGEPTRYPRVTSIDASPDAMVDLLNGALPSASGPLAPEMVHFACHGEVLGTGIARRSVLYMNDGQPLSEFLFVASALGRTKKSFLFMNACQVGNGGAELNQYAGFPGMAIGAGFSGFVGPLWSVNDQIAKRIAVDFYTRAFGADGGAPRAVAEVLADMRSQYATEPDPKKRQSTWLAYVHYGHPHFTFTHA